MRRRSTIVVLLVVLSTLGLMLWTAPANAATRHRDFEINRTLTLATTGPDAGDTVGLYGTGTFDHVTGQVDGQGSYTLRDKSGHVIARGSWHAMHVESWISYGSPDGVVEGGKLVLSVAIYNPDDTLFTITNDFTITCLIGNPPPGSEEGVTDPALGYTQPIEGAHRFTLFLRG